MQTLDLSNIISQLEVITSDGYLEASFSRDYLYYKRDFLYYSGQWRGNQVESLIGNSRELNKSRLVLGHSDAKTSYKELTLLKTIGFKKVWGINTKPVRNFSGSLPLGLVNDCDDSSLHRILGNIGDLKTAHETTPFLKGYDKSIYVNFSTNTNSKIRSGLSRILSSLPNVTYTTPDFSQRGHISYLSGLRTHSFVICPEGNGVDTHRIWETLYMGGIPIILGNPIIDSLVSDLPVLRLSRWNELSSNQVLEEYWEHVNKSQFDYKKLYLSYWLSKMSNSDVDLGRSGHE